MTRNLLLKKLRIDGADFVDSKRLKHYCSSLGLEYSRSVRYLLARKYMIRIFRGIFYLRSIEERDTTKSSYNHLELVAKGLELKGIKGWYFGLHTALKLNNATHESFSIEDVMSASLFRAKPIGIAGHRFKFYKISSKLVSFGVLEKENLRYSDLEKTLLDFAYIWRYGGMSEAKIADGLSEWSDDASRDKIDRYIDYYPKAIKNAIDMAIT